MKSCIRIYTDGSCIGNPGPGGWGAVIRYGKEKKELSGSVSCTTISEMELVAAVKALGAVPTQARVKLYSDSQYLIRGMRGLLDRWEKQGWRNRKQEMLKDRDVWMQLSRLAKIHEVRWSWVRGHSGHPMQVQADKLAYAAARAAWVLRRAA